MKKPSDIQELADALGGLAVFGVIPGSPVALCGVRYGDVVLTTNGYTTRTLDEFFRARATCESHLELEVFREGRLLRLNAPLSSSRELSLDQVSSSVIDGEMLPTASSRRQASVVESRFRS
ncbi:MAG TPA: hypothetical protein VFQ61_38210 [Polyangiaceae bacterium]|nr:hypothetical protein [Polyangiaceae bacterium]